MAAQINQGLNISLVDESIIKDLVTLAKRIQEEAQKQA